MSEVHSNPEGYQTVNNTEAWARSLSPDNMDRLTTYSDEEVEQEFAALATSHLSKWNETANKIHDGVEAAEFAKEEVALLQLELLKSVKTHIDDTTPVRAMDQGSDISEPIQTWGDVTGLLEQITKVAGKRRVNVLVTGLPISGKATIRRGLTGSAIKNNPRAKVASIDRDYSKLYPETDVIGDINIVEDIHGLDPESANSKEMYAYDLVIYTRPSEFERDRMIRSRGAAWDKNISGKADLTDGTGAADDPTFLRKMEIWRGISRAQQGKDVLTLDMPNILALKERGVPILILDSSEVIKAAYQ